MKSVYSMQKANLIESHENLSIQFDDACEIVMGIYKKHEDSKEKLRKLGFNPSTNKDYEKMKAESIEEIKRAKANFSKLIYNLDYRL